MAESLIDDFSRFFRRDILGQDPATGSARLVDWLDDHLGPYWPSPAARRIRAQLRAEIIGRGGAA